MKRGKINPKDDLRNDRFKLTLDTVTPEEGEPTQIITIYARNVDINLTEVTEVTDVLDFGAIAAATETIVNTVLAIRRRAAIAQVLDNPLPAPQLQTPEETT